MKDRLVTTLPGLGVFTVLWVLTLRNLEWIAWVDYLYGALWQGLGRHLLESDPWGSLSVLHIQPPGLMSMKVLNLAVTPDGHEFLSASLFGLGALSVVFVVDSLSVSGLRRRWAALAGVGYALLPSTVVYTLFPFSTTPTIFACSLAIWGVVMVKRSPVIGALASSMGVFFLFAFRTSFIWVFVLLWLAALTWLVVRWTHQSRQRFIAVGGVVIIAGLVVGVQAHYLASFGLWTTTSWSGENVIKALAQSGNLRVTGEAIEAADRLGECEGSLARDLAGGNAPSWLPEHVLALAGCGALRHESQTGVEALDSPLKDGVYDGQRAGNFNWSQRLTNSRVFSRVALEVVKAEPMQLVFMAVSGGVSGSRASGVSLYLAPSDDYGWVNGIREGYPNKTLGGLLSLVFAPAALTLTLVGVLLAILRRDGGRIRRNAAFWFSLTLVGYHVLVSNLFEYGENNRFQAEVAPALMFMGALTLWVLLSGTSSRPDASVSDHGSNLERTA